MNPSETQLRLFGFLYASGWLIALLFSPSCRASFYVSQAIGDALGTVVIVPIAVYLLVRNVRATHDQAQIPLKSPAARAAALMLLVVGILGCVSSLGCMQLETWWPTLQTANPFINRASSWKILGQALMVVGFVGLLVMSTKPKKPRT